MMTRIVHSLQCGRIPVFFLAAGLACLAGCATEPWVGADSGDVVEVDLPGIPPDRSFSAPEGITIWNNRVLVTNANFAYQGSRLSYGKGFLTVIDRETGAVVNIIPLPFENPQEVVVSGDMAWVLCSGTTEWNQADSTVVSSTSGGLAGIELEGIDSAVAVSVAIPIATAPGSLVGYPSGMFIDGDLAWIASGTTAALFLVDLVSGTVLRDGSEPVNLSVETTQNTTVVGPGPGGLMTLGLFNDDTLLLFDPAARIRVDVPWAPSVVGQQGMMDGIIDIEQDATRTYVLLNLANQVIDFDTGAGPAAGVRKLAGGLLSPNRMKLLYGSLYVVNSGDNSLAVIDTATGARRDFGLPVNCNPWDLAVGPDEAAVTVWVTCLKNDSVVRLETGDGSLLEVE